MKDRRPSKTRLRIRIASINRQLGLIGTAEADLKKNFPMRHEADERVGTTDLNCEISYRGIRYRLESRKEDYQQRLEACNFFGDTSVPREEWKY